MKNETYTVKLSGETKRQWQDAVAEVMREHGLATIGEAYPVIIDIIRAQANPPAPELDDYMTAIRVNLDSVRQNVLAMDAVYKSEVENRSKAIEEAKAGLVTQLESSAKENRELRAELGECEERLKESQALVEALREENEELRANRDMHQELMAALAELRKLKESGKKGEGSNPGNPGSGGTGKNENGNGKKKK